MVTLFVFEKKLLAHLGSNQASKELLLSLESDGVRVHMDCTIVRVRKEEAPSKNAGHLRVWFLEEEKKCAIVVENVFVCSERK